MQNWTTLKKLESQRREEVWYPAKPTKVLDTYWRFAVERQNIFFNRFYRRKLPWTSDPIFIKYKFTNAYRAADRVSQFLIKKVIYNGDNNLSETFFRIIVFKIFNKIETWLHLKSKLEEISFSNYSFKSYNKILTEAFKNSSIYSAAYIMASGKTSFGKDYKHSNHLLLIEKMMRDNLPVKIQKAKNMQEVFELLRSYPTIGDFLAYQLTTDINYSSLTNFNEMSFVVPGPGALDGISKCFSDLGGLTEIEIIKKMCDMQEKEFERLELQFKDLWGRRLQLIDCQNLFCEVGKYSRVAHPEIIGDSNRTRIKQKFKMNSTPIEYWFPPKWGINDKIMEEKKNVQKL